MRDRCEPRDVELHLADLVSLDVVVLGAPVLLVQPQAGFMVDGQSLRTRQLAGRPILGTWRSHPVRLTTIGLEIGPRQPASAARPAALVNSGDTTAL